MKAIKRLLAATLVAVLPVACGTVAPTGTDTATLDAADAAKRPRPAAPTFVRPPPPFPDGEDGARKCVAVVAEVLILRGSEPEPLQQESVLLYMAMLDESGREARDGMCQGVRWSIEASGFAAGPFITVGADTRYASVAGLAGSYRVRATAPNGLAATVGITLR